QDTSRYLIIRNCTILDVYEKGIYLNNVTNTVITNCTIQGGPEAPYQGIRLFNVTYVNVTHCVINNGGNGDLGGGITLVYSSNNYLTGNLLAGNNYGISLDNSTNNTLAENNIIGAAYDYNSPVGIAVGDNSTDNTLLNNHVTSIFQGTGIEIDYSPDNVLTANNVSSNVAEFWTEGGIVIWEADHCILTNNIADNNFGDGILLLQSSNVLVSNNTDLSNKFYWAGDGIDLIQSNNCSISNNNASNNNYHGIDLVDSDFNTVTGNDFSGNINGCIQVYFSYINNYSFGEDYWHEFVNGNLIYNNAGCFFLAIPGGGLWILGGIAAFAAVLFMRHRKASIRTSERKTAEAAPKSSEVSDGREEKN
ncbi:MAG TPA: right-handed parallel beta-helix repeat-containing protein, partial [Candidatus Lokiarchaeia archaeon]|nr:right-handed parallel beta-helix repeat-containing protein [Candidatus Lokiarchaeia archaeon]